jgi:hypothetical protein
MATPPADSPLTRAVQEFVDELSGINGTLFAFWQRHQFTAGDINTIARAAEEIGKNLVQLNKTLQALTKRLDPGHQGGGEAPDPPDRD